MAPSHWGYRRKRQALTDDLGRKLDVPPEWEAAAAEIFQHRLRTVLVMGGSAVGKSSFCRYLAGALLARQAEVAFVDADIGQSNLGPPAAVTLRRLSRFARKFPSSVARRLLLRWQHRPNRALHAVDNRNGAPRPRGARGVRGHRHNRLSP